MTALYRLIHAEKANYPVTLLRRVLHVTRSSYYASLDLPDDVGMPPAHYAVYVEARRADPRQGFTLLRLGPYTQAQDASWDADRIDAALVGRATTVRPRFKVAARRARSPSATTSSSPTRTRPTSSRSWPPPYQGRPPEG
ncbi:hypothetical protein OG379_39005 [Streptomyces sp. NBC_01166]|uniref:hypothetical protein n=1 Tax=Streptomyces sp. NBC_01166 TaxID=2903755 RepID=UPI00386763C5|nr:hypothetical protein OG379_39005 [Streptomyces sp. NBC_01166]